MAELFAPDFKEQPYWWEAAPPPDAMPAPLPDGIDVAIIGGGYAGLSAALELRRQGVAVAVLEAERIGYGASSRNGGMVSGGLKLATGELSQRFGAERAQAIVDEAAQSLPFIEDLIRREGIECHYARSGRFVGAHAPSHYRDLESRVDTIRTLTGMRVEMLPRERQREEIGSDHYCGGMLAEAYGALHPALYHQGLAAAARQAGVVVIDGTRVTGLAREEHGIRIMTARGAFRAREAMLATNGYTGGATPWFQRRVIPVASYIIATEPLDPALIKRLIPNGRMISDTKRVLNYYRLSPDGTRVLFGGRASFRAVDARTAAPRLHGFMTAIWPELANTRITHAWNGNVAFTFDFVPHMGVHDGVHYALGCQGSGVAMQTYLGYQVALKITGRANRPCAFDGLPFPTMPLYHGHPWFLPILGWSYRMRDWWDRRAA